MRVVFEIPGEPRGKARPRMTRQGHTYTPAPTRNYEAAVRMAAGEAMAGRAPTSRPCCVQVNAYRSVPASWSKARRQAALDGRERWTSKPDADNVLKVIDGCNGVVWLDDSQVWTATVRKMFAERPRVEISVEWETEE